MDTKLQQLLEEAHGLVQRVEPKEVIPNIDDYFIIDVREPDEVAQSGKVKGALNIPRGVLEFRMKPDQEIKADQPILIYCGGGSRAALAGKTLLEIGFTNVQNLGGFKDWVEAGGEIDSPA
jgi:rhodanese-related sulfurtransferase